MLEVIENGTPTVIEVIGIGPQGPVGLARLRIVTYGDDGDIAVTDNEVLIDASLAPITRNLPPAAGTGQLLHIKKIDATDNVITIAAVGDDLIDDSTLVALTEQWADCMLIDASAGYWDIIVSA